MHLFLALQINCNVGTTQHADGHVAGATDQPDSPRLSCPSAINRVFPLGGLVPHEM